MAWNIRFLAVCLVAISGLLPVLYQADSHFDSMAEAAADRELVSLKDELKSQLQRYQDATRAIEKLGIMDEVAATRTISAEKQAAIDTLRFFLSAESLFVMDERGTQIAGSGAVSVGQNYGFRPYFQKAINGSSYVYPGIGKNSPTPRMFFSAPHYSTPSLAPSGIVGLSVGMDKMFDVLKKSRSGTILGLITEDGVVFATSFPGLLYKTVLPLSAARIAEIRQSRQFADSPLDPSGFFLDKKRCFLNGTRYFVNRDGLNGTNIELFSLHPENLVAYWLFIGGVAFIYLLIIYLGGRLALTLAHIKAQQKALQEINASLLESQRALSYQATHDPLTDLLNRRGGMELLAKELVRSERNRESLALGMCDIDHFKRINDTWGHQVGDEVLRGLARMLKTNVREYDIVARMGGEEFLLVVPYKAGVDADSVFERFCKQVAESPLPTKSGALPITISIGVAYASPSKDIDGLLEEADGALYQAKAQGRNRVVYAPGNG